MGMTYAAFIVPKGTVDYKKHHNDDCLDYLLEDVYNAGECIMDDDTFDRERLGLWLGLTQTQYDHAYEHGYCFISADQIRNAIKTLKDLDERVHKMPFKVEGKNIETNRTLDKETNSYIGTWEGPKENEAIYREVMKFFNREYHYIWPWDEQKSRRDNWGCSEYIKELESALEMVEDALTAPDYPNTFDIALFYY